MAKSSISDEEPCAKILYAKIIREYLKHNCIEKMQPPKFIYDHTDEKAWEQTLNISTSSARTKMRTYIKKVKNKTLNGGIPACSICKYS